MRSKLKEIYDPTHFRQLGHTLIDLLADHHEASLNAETPRSFPWEPPDTQLQFWEALDKESITPEDLFQHILSHSITIHDPRYIGHQVGMPAPTGVLFSLLSSYLNNGMAVYEMGMAANCLEKLIIDECCARFGLGAHSGGLLTSGGTLANLTAMLSARRAMEDRWRGKTPAILVSEEAHYCIARAAKTMGWPPEAVIHVPTDADFRMQTERLESLYKQAMERGQQVIAVVGCACSTSTGSYDDLETIADFCEQHDLWFHVDGAHGAAVVFSHTHAHLLKGAERANSIVLDFHKLLMAPALATALLYKNNQDSFRTFEQESAYLLDLQQDWYNSGKRTFECTKYMICTQIYSIVKTHGWDAFGENVDELYENARTFATSIAQRENLVLGAPVQSNILCFRFVEEGLTQEKSNAQNAFIRHAIVERGEYYIVQTFLRGYRFLRLAVMNPFTTLTQFENLCTQIESYAKAWHESQ